MGELRIDKTGVSKKTINLTFVRNGTLNNSQYLRLSDNAMGDSNLQPFTMPFSARIKSISVSTRVFSRNFDLVTMINGVSVNTQLLSSQRQTFSFALGSLLSNAGDLSVQIQENPTGAGSNNDIFVHYILEEI